MMNAFDLLQEKKIGWLIGAFAVLGTVVAAIAYIDQKKHNQLQKEVIELDKEIKKLQLNKLKNGENA
jgi:uncharacterized membrane protein (DUF106 family)